MQATTLSRAAGGVFALALLVAGAFAGEPLKSGPQPGDTPSAFDVEDVTGPNKGKTLCYV